MEDPNFHPAVVKPDESQPELFPIEEPKIFEGASGIDLPYWLKHSGGADVKMPDGQSVSITKQGTGPTGECRYYAAVFTSDGKQEVQARYLKSVLAQLAFIAKAIELGKKITELAASIQSKAKQQDDLLQTAHDLTNADTSELEKELESAKSEIARLRAEFESKQRGPINTAAVQWAYHQKELSFLRRSVLIALAMHADRNFETWVSAGTVALEIKTHRTTALDHITALLHDGLIYDTGRRAGSTGQVKVLKLVIPERVGQTDASQIAQERVGQTDALKSRRSVGQTDTNEERVPTPTPPAVDRDELIVSAAEKAGESCERLIAALQPFFPKLKVAEQWDFYIAWCKDYHKSPIAVCRENPEIFTFVTWLKRAVPTVPQPKQEEGPHEQKRPKTKVDTAAERRAAERAREFPEPQRPLPRLT